MPAVEENLNRWIQQEAETMCRAAGMDTVPMSSPHFDYYRYGVKYLAGKYRMRGVQLDEMTSDVIQLIFFPINRQDRSTTGKMYDFPKWYDRHLDRARNGFDDFFSINFHQQATTIVRWRSKRKYRPGIPILPGKDVGDPAGISEEALSGEGETPLEILERQEEDRNQKRSMEKIPEILSQQRGGTVLVFVWNQLRVGATLEQIAAELNQEGESDPEYRTPRGGLWSAGTVYRLKVKIEELVREWFGVDEITASRRKKIIWVKTPRAVIQRGAQL